MNSRRAAGPAGVPYSTVRIAASFLVAAFACALFAAARRVAPGPSDFYVIWHASRIFLAGQNPYELIGPGRMIPFDWELHYPASTLVAAAPLTLFQERTADFVFVFSSAFLLAYGALRENLDRIWIFASAAFVVNAKSAQWSALTASGFFLPLMGIALCLKPSDGFAILAGTGRRTWLVAAVSALVLLVVSLIMMPEWPRYWISSVTTTWEFVSPVRRAGGFILLLAALRLRTKEGRLLLALALVPQVQSWYAALLPLLVARSKRENQILSLTSSLGYVLLIPLAMSSPTHEISAFDIGRMMVAYCYLPALIVVLKRDNTNDIHAGIGPSFRRISINTTQGT